MVLLSALLSIPLASWLVKPLLKLKSAIVEVSQGNYAHRVGLSRKDEIGDLAQGINSLAGTLEQNRDARRRWVAEISHELRTPVSVLQAELEAMQDGLRRLDAHSVDSIHSEVRKLAHLIDDLHQLSLSDTGALEYRMAPLCLGIFIEAQMQSVAGKISETDLQISIDANSKPFLINADKQRLAQLVANLLQNSVRYTDSPGEVAIAVARTANGISLSWEDSAPGVLADELTHLFEPLYRAEKSRSRAHGGSGLGLSIVSRIVQAHGGDIQAAPSRLGGLKLVIEFPALSKQDM